VNVPVKYRPISNVNTSSEMLEGPVLTRIIPHVSFSPSVDTAQSAYRGYHATETALLKITDDIFAHFANHQSTILDQSASFDCIDHATLIRCLQSLHQSFGVKGKALSWISSYLESCYLFVRWKQVSSVQSRNRRATRVCTGTSTFLPVHCTAL